MQHTLWAIVLVFLLQCWTSAQNLTERPPGRGKESPVSSPAVSVPLTVPAGTPLKVALDRDVRVHKVGQVVHGKTLEPIFAFHQMVVSAGSEVVGEVIDIQYISKKRRLFAAMNANLSPTRDVQIGFSELVLGNGDRIPIQTEVFPESIGGLKFVAAGPKNDSPEQARSNFPSRKIHQAGVQVKASWRNVRDRITAPQKVHRLGRYAFSRLPYHPQYLDTGSSFVANLKRPVDFGTTVVEPDLLTTIGSEPPLGSVVHAVLITPLSSATSKKGDVVQAVINQPLLVEGRLFFPEGCRLVGTVTQVRPASRFGRNGQMRIVFREIILPGGRQRKIEGELEGIVVAKSEHLKLDSEGGARVVTPEAGRIKAGLAVVKAASALADDRDYHGHISLGSKPGAATHPGGFNVRFLGSIASTLSHSGSVASGFSMYGASMSVYSHFLSRGRDVEYRQGMSMIVGFDPRGTGELVSDEGETIGLRARSRPFGPL